MQTLEFNNVYNMDCLEGMMLIPDGSIDMILCDLPYGIVSGISQLSHFLRYGSNIIES